LTIDQYKALLEAIPEVNAQLGEMGIPIGGSADAEEESEEEAKPRRRIKAKKAEKSNIDATSDEEED